jgi:hypothetical protein
MSSDLTSNGGSGMSQAAADARYVNLDGSTPGGTAGTQTFNGSLTVLGANLRVGTSGSASGALILLNASNTRTLSINAATPASQSRSLTIDWSAMSSNRTLTFPDGNVNLTPLVSPTGSGNAVLATSPTITTPTLTTSVHNGVKVAVRTVTVDYTVTITDYVVAIDAGGDDVTVTIPAANDAFAASAGSLWRFKRIDETANVVTIIVQPLSGDTIDGASSVTLTALAAKDIVAISTATFAVL